MTARSATRAKAANKINDDEVERLLRKPTITVPQAGMIYGLSRNGSYEAARRGDIETIQMGKLLIVPTAPIRRKLGIEA
jgi:hypothetical protein